MSTHDEPLDLDPHQAFNDFAQVMQTSDQLFDDEQGLLGMSSQPVEAGSVAYFTGQQRALHQQDAGLQAPSDGLSHLARAAEYSRFHDVVPRAVEGKQGLLISVFTSANITTAASSRTRIGALKYLDVPDRAGFMHQLLERISLAKTRLYHHIGFDVRSCTYIVEGEHIWVILIGLVAMSFGKWHKVFLRLGALDIKTVCIHRQLAAGTQSSLETAADMFNGLTTVEELVRHEIVCHQPATPDGAKKGGKRKASPTSKKAASPARKRTTPVSERVQTASPARKQKAVRAALFVSEEQQEDDGQPPFVTPSPCGGFVYARKDLVDECLAFLTSKDMPPVEAHRDRLLEYLTSIPHYGHIGMYMLSQHPLELFARAMHLRVAVIRVLGERYGIDARGSLSTMTLVSAGGYERMTPASQAALRMIGQCVDHDRDFPIFTFLDMGVVLAFISLYVADQSLGESKAGDGKMSNHREVQFLDAYRNVVIEQSWWFVTIGCRLSRFLELQRGTGFALHPWEEALLFPNAEDETQAVLDCFHGFSVLQHAVRSRGSSSFSLKARYFYYKAKPVAALGRIKQAYKVKAFGKAVEVFQLVQENARLFYDMLQDNPVYRGLPATKFSDDPASHVHTPGDSASLARLLCAQQRIRG